MIIYPAIDLKSGRAVRLEQGRADRETVYFADPAEPARLWRDAGTAWLHVVDLDGAFSGLAHPANWEAIRRILALGLKVQLGGGMRDEAAIERALGHGVTRVVIGTRAATDPDFVSRMVALHGADKVAVGIDAKNGMVAVKGWVETSSLTALDLATRMEQCGVKTLIYTDISRDGLLMGPNFEAQEQLLKHTRCNVIASGGVARLEDIERLALLARSHANLDGVITGKALYEGALSLADALRVVR
ncbi:MAG: 1-(5-phosphoribosyl)-5-[(5-phosphoribosylamino)methylideneamino]imidazole-4-carboxamide isomerase [Verrucomicrobiota bacterium]|nr:1-(5-phosphoribosyl)-5-[(5-phosphoribosylamino)methylideneamino]imidazole-4-carboxamide isomerase [Verrucomicrobiota bacterium]